jgi:hypothetical protein
MIRLLTLAAFTVAILATSPASAACLMSYCETPATYEIKNLRRQTVGDFYDPGHGRPIQIRNNRRQILGYIEKDGTITNTRRQEVLNVEPFGFAVD